jgi:hypothetical protein
MAEEQPTRKKTTSKKTTGKTTTSKRKRSTAGKSDSGKKTPKRTSRTVSLSADLKKYAGESYETSELLRGALLIVDREGADAIRTAVLTLAVSQIPLAGEQLAGQTAHVLVGQLADDYKQLKTAERKGVRGVINWLTGAFTLDSRTTNELMAALSGPAAEPGAVIEPPAPLPASAPLKAAAQGFLLPPRQG